MDAEDIEVAPKQRRARAAAATGRPSLLDYLDEAEKDAPANKYCAKIDLSNEADVEQFFVGKLLVDLGYRNSELKLKDVLPNRLVARGSKKEAFRPDYLIEAGGRPRWVLDAKSPDEGVDSWTYQAAGYAHGVNQEYEDSNPCQYYALTNGIEFKLYRWDLRNAVLRLGFADFDDSNPRFHELVGLLAAPVVRKGWTSARQGKGDTAVLRHPSVGEVKSIFNTCHRLIWKTEKLNPQAAFFEFTKVMFVKLWEDRKLHLDANLGPLIAKHNPIPRSSIIFSTQWIDLMESSGADNPIDTLLFKKLSLELAEAVDRGKKKEIFPPGERIRLSSGTLRLVVERLQHVDMFGIDEDLNGRLFETFLSATMRGDALGQYFTPRSIVKLMTKIAAPHAGRDRIDRVIDACCGTGGFLIEALADMRAQVNSNQSLADGERKRLLDSIANDSIFGIDAGREPPLARIARINMYLHGDGGSRIYALDSLNKRGESLATSDLSTRREVEEYQALLKDVAQSSARQFDIALTNPPFAMDYQQSLEQERRILDLYDLSHFGLEGTIKKRSSLRSSTMFIERYADLLRPGGALVTVIDDAILGGSKYGFARDYIRSRYMIRAVISLPGDAFRRAGARAKTSILVLRRRGPGESGQPAAFMSQCQYVGLDDVPPKTRQSQALAARQRADDEMASVIADYERFLGGESGSWLVPADKLGDRLDAKSCLPRPDDVERTWLAAGLDVRLLSQVVDRVETGILSPARVSDKSLSMIRVTYSGIAERAEEVLAKELTYANVQRPAVGDIVVSHINAVQGSIGVVTNDLDGAVVSPEFTVLRVRDPDFDPWFVWAYLRSPEARARMVSDSTGVGRHRIGWDTLKGLPIPKFDPDKQRSWGSDLARSILALREAEAHRLAVSREIGSVLNLDNDWAVTQLQAAKPPR